MISSRTISFNESAYQAHIHSLLEPESVIITGTRRRYHEIKRNVVIVNPSPDNRTEDEIERSEDEWLGERGITTKNY